ncbi:MAG: hypothetical protein EA362_07860 [Saprospirales bacterium]|nr:MAG: hypothetical protein EA362_07860 [Saprospirales bacterium]
MKPKFVGEFNNKQVMEMHYSRLSILDGEIYSSEFTIFDTNPQEQTNSIKHRKLLEFDRICNGRKTGEDNFS